MESSILVTGAQGQVAKEIDVYATQNNLPVILLTRDQLDITSKEAVNTAIRHYRPRVVINAAAFTQVDLAEEKKNEAHLSNVEGPARLTEACKLNNACLIHLSTDYVFDGNKKNPYRENDPINPLNYYGQTKWEGEEAIRATLKNHVILRVSSVFGVSGNNFVKTMLRLMKAHTLLRVVNDQMMCPTPSYGIAETLLTIAKNPIAGTYHYCGDIPTTWHAFSSFIAEEARRYGSLKVEEIKPITTEEYPLPAKRPPYSVLDCSHLESIYGIMKPSWKKGCSDVIRSLSTT